MVKKLFLSTILLLGTLNLQAYNVVFDLGDVLVATDRLKVFYAMGPLNILKYVLFDKQNPKQLQKKIFDVLDHLGKQKEQHGLIAAYSGRALPQIMCDWLMGTKRYEAIMQEIYDCTDMLSNQHYFVSMREREIIELALEAMFNPFTFAKNVYCKPEGLELLRTIVQKGHSVYILSNWDPESFAYLSKQPAMRSLFELVEHKNIVISGTTGYMKPQALMFNYFLETYNLNPDETYFIDDMVENCIAADRAGMHSIQLVEDDYLGVERFLSASGVL